MLKRLILLSMVLSVLSSAVFAASYYPQRLEDASAIYVTPEGFPVRGDGVGDDTAALQQAIDKVAERHHEGIVFLPSGRYRLMHTIHIWPGIRLIGYGVTRPVLVVAPNTPYFQKGPAYMVFFAGNKPVLPAVPGVEPEAHDANPGTFYSAMSNIDIEIGDGNPGAVGVRARYAQHCYLAHMDFRIGAGLAGIHDGGNVAEDDHFFGGQYGIWTRKPSPGWQFSVIDATFEGQREAAIREHEAGLTLVRPQFKNVPTAIEIDPGFRDELWIKDALLDNVTGPAFIIANQNNAHTEINMENVICRGVLFLCFVSREWKTDRGERASLRGNYVFSRTALRRYRRYAIDTRHLRRISAWFHARAHCLGYCRFAADEDLGRCPYAGCEGRWHHRRHRRDPEGHRCASNSLFSP